MEYPHAFIFHVDLDAFFASVVVLDKPELQGLPIIVGADPKKGKGRGVVSTCSYEAREFGIHSAMPISQAYRNCPHGVYVRADFKRVKEISNQVMEILHEYSDIVQQTSIDEAYLDCTSTLPSFYKAYRTAFKMKERVKKEVGVTCSVGVSFSKTLAKIGSDCNKPDGITVITPNNYQKILYKLNLTRIPGIGKKTKNYYYRHGFQTIGDIYQSSLPKIRHKLGENGIWVWNKVHGLDKRKVHDGSIVYNPKSISKERTFSQDTEEIQDVITKIEELNEKLHQLMEKKDIFYKTITIKIRFQGFDTYTRAQSVSSPIRNQSKAMQVVISLLDEFVKSKKKIRLIGLKFSNFAPMLSTKQTTLSDFLS